MGTLPPGPKVPFCFRPLDPFLRPDGRQYVAEEPPEPGPFAGCSPLRGHGRLHIPFQKEVNHAVSLGAARPPVLGIYQRVYHLGDAGGPFAAAFLTMTTSSRCVPTGPQ